MIQTESEPEMGDNLEALGEVIQESPTRIIEMMEQEMPREMPADLRNELMNQIRMGHFGLMYFLVKEEGLVTPLFNAVERAVEKVGLGDIEDEQIEAFFKAH